MSGFLGNYASLSGHQLPGFTVEGIAGRNPGGEPRWTVVCREGHAQILPHGRLAKLIEARQTQINNLQCPKCPASRTAHQSETLADVHRRERREAQAAAAQAAETAKIADAAAVRQQMAEAQRLALQREYITFWSHQLRAGTPNVLTRKRWEQLHPGTRSRILERIAADPTLQVSE